MTKAKKVLSFCLAVVMVIGMFAFSAFAAAETATITVSASQTAVKTGDVIDVTVKLTTDYFVGPTQLPIHYNADVLQFVNDSATGMDLFGANGATSFVHAAKSGCVQFGFTPVTAKGAVAQKLSDATVVTFQLRAIKDGSSEVALHAEDQKSSGNANGQLYVGSFTSSNTDEVANPVGQTLKLTGTTVNVGGGSTAAPELQLSARGQEIGAVISKNYGVSDGYTGVVMGIDTLGLGADGVIATLSEALSTPAGSIEIDTSATGGVETTGALIKLLDAENSVVETYVFVYFGDVNQDGSVDSSDASLIEENEFYISEITEEYRLLSGDVNADTTPDSSDAGLIEEFEFYVIESLPTQAECAGAYA